MSAHNLCFEQKYEKNIGFFLSEKFLFLVVKFSIHLDRRVLVMVEHFSYMFGCILFVCGHLEKQTAVMNQSIITKTHLFKYTENYTTKN